MGQVRQELAGYYLENDLVEIDEKEADHEMRVASLVEKHWERNEMLEEAGGEADWENWLSSDAGGG